MSVKESLFLAAHTVLMAHAENPTYVGGLDIAVFHRETKKFVLQTDKSRLENALRFWTAL